jgi:site-specific recombinase XerD
MNHLISTETIAFLTDRRASQRSPRTLQYYANELHYFAAYCASQTSPHIEDLTPTLIRQYLIHLSQTRNPGGLHAAYRAIKAFLNWWTTELDDPAYKNPITKVTPPKPSKEPLPGIPMEHVRALLLTCDRKTPLGQRDRSIITTLIDTGIRKEELVSLNLSDLDPKTGALHIQHGKGDKPRTVYLGAKALRELHRYLRNRPDPLPHQPLYTNQQNTRLTGAGLRQVIRRHADLAHIPQPGLHDFRRTYALESLRNGIDIVTLMHLMGHTTTTILLRYLKLVERDLQTGHARSSPADTL